MLSKIKQRLVGLLKSNQVIDERPETLPSTVIPDDNSQKPVTQALIERVESTIDNSAFRFLDSRAREVHVFPVDASARYFRLSLQAHTCFHLSSVLIYDANDQLIGQDATVEFSSSYNDDPKHTTNKFLDGSKSGRLGFHTKSEDSPWVIIDLGDAFDVTRIEIMNRADEYFTRAHSLLIQSSIDSIHWQVVHDNWAVFKDGRSVSTLERALEFGCCLESSRAQKLIGEALAEGRSELAMDIQAGVNQLVRRWGLAMGPHGFTQTFELASAQQKQKAYSQLAQLLDWLNNEFGVAAFISSGTLLGIIRDGEFIGHDDDVDICYISNKPTEPEILAERQELLAFLRSKGCHTSFSGVAHYWCKTPERVHVDIFTGFIEGDLTSMNPIGRGKVKTTDVLPLKVHEVFGELLYLPQNPTPLLELNYGPNWKVKDPFWTFDWSQARRDFKFLYSEN